jgi:hypothetical protein
MRTRQIVMGTAVLVLVILLFSSPRHRVPVYGTSTRLSSFEHLERQYSV